MWIHFSDVMVIWSKLSGKCSSKVIKRGQSFSENTFYFGIWNIRKSSNYRKYTSNIIEKLFHKNTILETEQFKKKPQNIRNMNFSKHLMREGEWERESWKKITLNVSGIVWFVLVLCGVGQANVLRFFTSFISHFSFHLNYTST